MEVNERLEEPKTEEVLPDLAPEIAPGELAPEQEAAAPVWSCPSWLRLGYAFEFLIALLVVFTMWSQVGGQGHLDLLPWYIKLACTLSLAWCSVRFTAGLVEHEKAWNHHSALWFIGMLLVSILMGGITYWYHLHEVPDQPDTDDSTSTSLQLPEHPTLAAGPALPAHLKYGSGSGIAAPSLRGEDPA